MLRQATRLLRKRLDPLMLPFKATEPEFYAQYRAARRIVQPGTTESAATAKAKKAKAAKEPQPSTDSKAA